MTGEVLSLEQQALAKQGIRRLLACWQNHQRMGDPSSYHREVLTVVVLTAQTKRVAFDRVLGELRVVDPKQTQVWHYC